jgi:hypothetical protein
MQQYDTKDHLFRGKEKSEQKHTIQSRHIRLFNITVYILISQYSFSSLSFSHLNISLFRKSKELLITVIKSDELGRMWKRANTICLQEVIKITRKFTQNSEPWLLSECEMTSI